MTEQRAQRIIDHWHIGRLRQYVEKNSYFEIQTDKGVFLLFRLYNPKETTQQTAAKRAEVLMAVLYRCRQKGREYRIVPSSNTRGAVVAHVDHWHYSLYRLVKWPERKARSPNLDIVESHAPKT